MLRRLVLVTVMIICAAGSLPARADCVTDCLQGQAECYAASNVGDELCELAAGCALSWAINQCSDPQICFFPCDPALCIQFAENQYDTDIALCQNTLSGALQGCGYGLQVCLISCG